MGELVLRTVPVRQGLLNEAILRFFCIVLFCAPSLTIQKIHRIQRIELQYKLFHSIQVPGSGESTRPSPDSCKIVRNSTFQMKKSIFVKNQCWINLEPSPSMKTAPGIRFSPLEPSKISKKLRNLENMIFVMKLLLRASGAP